MRTQELFAPFEAEMRRAGASPMVIDTFHYYYGLLTSGQTGLIAEKDIEPLSALTDAQTLTSHDAIGREALGHTAIIKLNGGLGTSMGLERAKSLLVAKGGHTFLDIIVHQVLALRQQTGCAVPLLFMNSFNTDEDTRDALRPWPQLAVDGLPVSFLQNKIPKVLEDGYRLPDMERWGELAWCPPGHGDIYTALQADGILEALLERGFHYAFVSNADNLGATLDLNILGYMADKHLPYLAEVADRTEADKKGGHLARRKRDGRILLRETAQCAPSELALFQDLHRHPFFHTNNIWLDLRAVRRLLDPISPRADEPKTGGGIFRLPLIRNRKHIDPKDGASPAVVQLETAMGAAIELFDGAAGLRVPRSRFAPVKQCSDLLVLWSDAYTLTENYHLVAASTPMPVAELNGLCYKQIADMEARFPFGAPSLCECQSLRVDGDVTFGRDVVVRGRTEISASGAVRVADGTVLEGRVEL